MDWINAGNLHTVPTGHLQSFACGLECRLLSEKAKRRLTGRRWLRNAAERNLARDVQARELLPLVKAELDRRYNHPIDNIDQATDAQLLEIRGKWYPYILSRRQMHDAILSSLGTLDGDRALDADQKARAIVGQIDRELRRRETLVAA